MTRAAAWITVAAWLVALGLAAGGLAPLAAISAISLYATEGDAYAAERDGVRLFGPSRDLVVVRRGPRSGDAELREFRQRVVERCGLGDAQVTTRLDCLQAVARDGKLFMRPHTDARVMALFGGHDGEVLYVSAASDAERNRVYHALADDESVWVTGTAAAEIALLDDLVRTLALVGPLAALAMTLILWVATGSSRAAAIAIGCCGSATFCAIGSMAWISGAPGFYAAVAPVVTFAAAAADSIYLLIDLARQTGPRRIGAPVLRALVVAHATSALGSVFLSFSPNRAVADFGLQLTIGSLIALAAAVTLLPALIRLIGIGDLGRRSPIASAEGMTRALVRRCARGPIAIAFTAALAALAVVAVRVRFEDTWFDNLEREGPVVGGARALGPIGLGANTLCVDLSSGVPLYFLSEAGLDVLARAQRAVGGCSGVGATLSALDLVGDAALPAGGDAAELSPEQRVFLASMAQPSFASRLLSADARSARLVCLCPSMEYGPLCRTLDEVVTATASLPESVAARFSGSIPLGKELVQLTARGQLVAALATFTATAAMIIALYWRDRRLALYALLPCLLATVAVLAVCSAFSITLGIAGSLFVSQIAGTGLDHSVQLIERRRARGSSYRAMLECLSASALATALFCVALACLATSGLRPLVDYALLCGGGMILCWLSTAALGFALWKVGRR
ncbi:MAG TPA: MMPL family transporter [Planctomycetota bacterium]|nr:MMPL family transporter [Planctomycetota bacterium]